MKIYLFLLIQFFALNSVADDTNNIDIKVYRSPDCQCCHKWINHLEKNEFNVLDVIRSDMASVKQAVQLPKAMTSCHTALVEGYIIEGHVPAADIRRLLAERPNIAGLSVPKMPVGTPGMEVEQRKDNFNVFHFNKEGKFGIYSRYLLDENNDYEAHQHISEIGH